MIKPTPAKELIIKPPSGNLIYIEAHSQDARDWLTQQAHPFGMLMRQYPASNDVLFTLFVYEAYSPQEVAAWLESYNTSGETS